MGYPLKRRIGGDTSGSKKGGDIVPREERYNKGLGVLDPVTPDFNSKGSFGVVRVRWTERLTRQRRDLPYSKPQRKDAG